MTAFDPHKVQTGQSPHRHRYESVMSAGTNSVKRLAKLFEYALGVYFYR